MAVRELEWRLSQLLEERHMTLAALSDLTGIALATLADLGRPERLRGRGRQGIEYGTLVSICEALRCQPGDLLVLIESRFARFAREVGGALTIAFGSRPCLLLDPAAAVGTPVVVTAERRRTAIELWDERALATILPQLSWPVPALMETPCTLAQDTPRLPGSVDTRLRQPGLLIGLGSPLVSGLADVVLLEMQGSLAALERPPFYFVWGHQGSDQRPYHRYGGLGVPQGIAREDKLLVTVPSWETIEAANTGYTYDDACLLMICPMNRHISYLTYVTLAMGFMGPGTMAGASFLFSAAFGDLLADYRTQVVDDSEAAPNAPVPALCVVLRVPCKKTGGHGSRAVQPNEDQVKVVAVSPYIKQKGLKHDSE